MTFKEKHLLPLIFTAAMTTGCNEVKTPSFYDENIDNKGLLDERPLRGVDKYDADIVLYQVNVPVYKSNGESLKGQYVLTRGLKSSSYISSQSFESMSVKPVYFNGSREVCYVKADNNNAIYTERGFSGLFIDDDRKAVVISDENISLFSSKIDNVRTTPQRNDQNRDASQTNFIKTEVVDSLMEKIPEVSDSIIKDSVQKDSVVSNANNVFLDTLQMMRQKDIYHD